MLNRFEGLYIDLFNEGYWFRMQMQHFHMVGGLD
ncbi:hypothetical protein BBOMB_0363 [Bifidobacterium bombi DSM 19703]|uniref:Uncharacterized protein n=1 Tax=Bifidobacterium bombi DSM 19703 TaxID=1341695 RepID=A0A080N270_9BIFI|nr:hypothetical protein BBOMB_0363 [Bifidobacterium bombi DSM 19703]